MEFLYRVGDLKVMTNTTRDRAGLRKEQLRRGKAARREKFNPNCHLLLLRKTTQRPHQLSPSVAVIKSPAYL